MGAVGMVLGSLVPTAGNDSYRSHTALHGEHSHSHR
jgi:hypothetical protein